MIYALQEFDFDKNAVYNYICACAMHCMRKRQKPGQDVRNRRENTIPAITMRKPDHPNPKMMQINATTQ